MYDRIYITNDRDCHRHELQRSIEIEHLYASVEFLTELFSEFDFPKIMLAFS